jgi:hypothetical protein
VETERDCYLDVLWSVAEVLKLLYEKFPGPGFAAFQAIAELLNPDFTAEPIDLIAQFSASLWTDFLTYAPEPMLDEFRSIYQVFLNGITNTQDPDLRRIILFGAGRIFARFSGDPNMLSGVMSMLARAIQEGSENEELFSGNDSGLSSFALLLRKRLALGPAPQEIEQFFALFPPRQDMEEGEIACQLLLDLYTAIPGVDQFYEPIYQLLVGMLEIDDIQEFLEPQLSKLIENLGPRCPPQMLPLIGLLE